jgi:hypothetical protein
MRLSSTVSLTSLSISVALLAGCSGPMTTPGISSVSEPAAADARKLSLLFLAGSSSVEIYRVGHYEKAVRDITNGLRGATGTAVDSSGNLYVANTAGVPDVEVYAPGANKPFRTYEGGEYGPIYDPLGIAVAKDGTLYVANACCDGSPWGDVVSVFPPGSTQASEFLSLPDGFAPAYVAVDSGGNLFVSSKAGGAVFEFPSGSTQAEDLDLELAGSAGLAVDDAGHLLVADVYNKTVNVYQPPATKPLRQLNVGAEPLSIAFTKNYTSLFVTASLSGKLYRIAYATGKVNAIPEPGSGFSSVAVSPAAYP